MTTSAGTSTSVAVSMSNIVLSRSVDFPLPQAVNQLLLGDNEIAVLADRTFFVKCMLGGSSMSLHKPVGPIPSMKASQLMPIRSGGYGPNTTKIRYTNG